MKPYAIYAVTTPLKPGFLQKLLCGTCHSFLALTEERPGGTPSILSELHFDSINTAGLHTPTSRSIPNLLINAAYLAGFEKLAGLIERLSAPRVMRLKALAPRESRRDFGTLNVIGHVQDSPETIMGYWNAACRAAIAINEADRPFLQAGIGKKEPHNCHAGTKTVLQSLGGPFAQVAKAMHEKGAVLDIPGLERVRWPDEDAVRGISMESLLAAQAHLRIKLSETSRGLTRKEARSVPSINLTM